MNANRAEFVDIASLTNALDTELEHCSNSVRVLWAKSGDGLEWLSLPQHMADSASVAAVLWNNWVSDQVRRTLTKFTGLSGAETGALLVFLAGVHDIGKATQPFQGQVAYKPECAHLADAVEDAGFTVYRKASEGDWDGWVPHSALSEEILYGWLVEHFDLRPLQALPLAQTVGAHHGVPATAYSAAAEEEIEFQPVKWTEAQDELTSAIARASNVGPVLNRLKSELQSIKVETIQLLTGLIILSDWLASNTYSFPLGGWGDQGRRLEEALLKVDLTRPWNHKELPAEDHDYYRMSFGWPDQWEARPIQIQATKAARLACGWEGPFLFVIEAPTGVGKTEAGLGIAEIVGLAQGAQGVFLAAPTMATSNGLFDRTVEWASNTSSEHEVASMYLAHSKNYLNPSFNDLNIRNVGDEGSAGNVVATQWLNGPKKGVLANFSVGTVDQVLMMALQMRHLMLRHIGLAGKVIIIDEVHSYGVYMSSYLRVVLAWLARYGATVVLMSATLTPARRGELVEAFMKGLAEPGAEVDLESLASDIRSPLITAVNADGINTFSCPLPDREFRAEVEYIDDDLESLKTTLESTLADGGIALVVCNTVRRAQEAFETVRTSFPWECELHHSAFIATHRSKREDDLRQKLGPQAHRGKGRPDRLVVVATQVVEQSLDLDADMIITDLCPMDSFVQRVGRVARHKRPASDRPVNLQVPRIFLRGIVERQPVLIIDKGSTAVYDEAVLLATLLTMPSYYTRPQDNAQLVRDTYSLVDDKDPDDPTIPAAWHDAWKSALVRSEENRMIAEKRAKNFQLPLPGVSTLTSLYSFLTNDRSEEAGIAQVRDAEPTLEVIACEVNDYGVRVWGDESAGFLSPDEEPDRATARKLLASTIRLPVRMTRREKDFDAVVTDAEQQTPAGWIRSHMLKGKIAVTLDAQGRGRLGRFQLDYSRDLGLQVKADSP